MKTKSFYSKPTVKVVKIDCVYLQGTMSGYGPGGSGGGGTVQGQSVPEVPVSTEMEQE